MKPAKVNFSRTYRVLRKCLQIEVSTPRPDFRRPDFGILTHCEMQAMTRIARLIQREAQVWHVSGSFPAPLTSLINLVLSEECIDGASSHAHLSACSDEDLQRLQDLATMIMLEIARRKDAHTHATFQKYQSSTDPAETSISMMVITHDRSVAGWFKAFCRLANVNFEVSANMLAEFTTAIESDLQQLTPTSVKEVSNG